MKSATTVRASSSSAPSSMRWGSGSSGEHGVPRLGLAEPIEPGASVRDEQVGERRVVRAVAAIASGVEGVLRREEAPDRLHVVAEVHDAHREGDRLPLRVGRIAVAVPALEREAQRVADAGADVESLHEHVGDLAPGREVVDRPLAGGLLDHADDLVALLRAAAGRREGHHVPHHLGRDSRRRAPASGRGWRSRRRTRWRPRGRARCTRRSAAAPPSRRSRAPRPRRRRRRRSTSRAGTTAAATRAAARTRCPARAPASRRVRRGEAVCPKMGSPPDVSGRRGRARSSHDASPLSLRATERSLQRRTHGGITDPGGDPIKVGVITDQTGPLSVIGLANANVARMVVGDINAKGGLLGRHLELHLEDSATDDAVAAAKATKLVEHDQRRRHLRRHLQLHATGHQGRRPSSRARRSTSTPSSTRGRSPTRSSSAPAPCPRSRSTRSSRGSCGRPGRRPFYLPSADYIWPHVMNARVREVVTANGGEIVGEEYFPLDHADYRATVDRIAVDRRGRGLQHDRAARGRTVPRAAARLRLRRPRRTAGLHVLRGEPPRHAPGRRTSTGCTAASTTTRRSTIRSAGGCSPSTTRSIPARRSSPAAAGRRACTAGWSSGPPPSRKRARSRRRT